MSFILKSMETRNRWGIVYVAAIFALVVVLAAMSFSYFENKAKNDKVIAITKNFQDWQPVSNAFPQAASTTSAGVTAQVAQEIALTYDAASNQSLTESQKKDLLSNIIKSNIQPQKVVPNIGLVDLTISSSTAIDGYMQAVALILTQSSQVPEYELNTFARVVQNNQQDAVALLKQDADLYTRIAAALLILPVPSSLASDHLEVVKSVGALAKAVSNMGAWSGDPLESLSDIDTFVKADAYVENSVNRLLADSTRLSKKKS